MGKAGKHSADSDDGDGKVLTPFKLYAREVRRQAGAKAKDSGFTTVDLKAKWKSLSKTEKLKYKSTGAHSDSSDAVAKEDMVEAKRAKKARLAEGEEGGNARSRRESARAAAGVVGGGATEPTLGGGSKKSSSTSVASQGSATADEGVAAMEESSKRAERRKQFWEAKRKGKRSADEDAGDGDDGGASAEQSVVASAAVPSAVAGDKAASDLAALYQRGATAAARVASGTLPPSAKRRKRKLAARERKVIEVDEDGVRRRYLLFVGNMAFKTRKEDVQKHFGRFGGLIDVRMRTDKETGKFLGTCFVEYDDREAHGKALGLHHSKLCGRVINVELTVGGGGKSEARLEKLKEKNKRHLGIGGPESVNAIPLGPRKSRD